MTAFEAPPIVVVDDDGASRQVITRFLQRMQLRNPIETAATLAEARDRLSAPERAPALLLLDLHLPDGSGFDLLQELQPTVLGGTAVVVLTGSDELEHVDRAYALGAHSYLVKPVAFEALGDILRRVGLPWALLRRTDDEAAR